MVDNTKDLSNCEIWELPQFEGPKNLNKTMITAISTASKNQQNIIEEHKKLGYKAGYEEGLQVADREFLEIKQALINSIETINTCRNFINQDLEDKIFEFCIQVTKHVIEDEIVHSKKYLAAWIKQGLEHFSEQKDKIIIKINPALHDDIMEMNLLESDAIIELISDSGLAIGEVQILNNSSEVNISVSQLVDSVCRDMLRKSS